MNSRPPSSQAGTESAAELLTTAKRAVVLTGAGVSTPSGSPGFRSDARADTGIESNVALILPAIAQSVLHG
jgi:hypothetical protein